MNIVWSPQAVADLAALRAYIAEDNKAAAQRTVLRIIRAVEELLADNPDMRRPGRANSSFRERPIWFPIAYGISTSRCCAFITARDDGRRSFETGEGLLRTARGEACTDAVMAGTSPRLSGLFFIDVVHGMDSSVF
jgi:plasmid stabilization system protein ParE